MAQTKTIDITPARIKLPVIEVSQFDIGRPIIIHMKDGADWYDLTGLTVKLQGTKPSGFGYSVTGTVNGHDVTFTTIYDMTSESGFILSEVSIIDGTDVIGSQNVMLHVEQSPHPPEIVDGSPETILPEMRELVERAEAAAEILLDCSATATTLPTGSSATASYDPDTGVFSFGLPRGDTGAKGDTGETGNGISNIRKTSTSGLVDTYTITYTDGTSTTFTVTNGQNGTGSVADVTQNGVSVLDGTVAKVVADANVQSDWNESDTTDDAYIKNKPSIPSKTSDLTNDSGFITSAALPTNLSDLQNDVGYLTTETDPVFGASPAAGITASHIVQWNGITLGDYTDTIANTIASNFTNLPNNGMSRLVSVLANGGMCVGFMYRYSDTYGGGSLIKYDGTHYNVYVNNGAVTVTKGDVYIVSLASFSSLPSTFYDSGIRSDHVCMKAELGTPSAQTGDWNVTPAAGSVTISGSISGSTTAKLYFETEQEEYTATIS